MWDIADNLARRLESSADMETNTGPDTQADTLSCAPI